MNDRGTVGLILWVLALVGAAGWILWANNGEWHFFWLTLGRMSAHWFLTALAIALVLMASGQIGADLGIPQLFHDEPGTALLRSRAFWGAFGAGAFFAESWTIINTLEFFRPEHYPPLNLDVSDAAWAGFPEPPSRFGLVRNLKFLAVGGVPWLVLYVLAAVLPAPSPGAARRQPALVPMEVVRCLLGIALALALLVAIASAGKLITYDFQHAGEARLVPWEDIFRLHGIGGRERNSAAAVLCTLLLLLAMTVPVWFFTPLQRLILPGLGITILFWLLGGFYFLLQTVQTKYQPVLMFLGVLALVIGNNGPYKYRIPGIGQRNGRSLYARGNRLVLETAIAAEPPTAAQTGLVDDRRALENWRDQVQETRQRARPKLVVLTTSGGAYRSAFWTATVLDELARRAGPGQPLARFLDHIRLVTGASGGMVGAGYFVAMCADGNRPDGDAVSTVGVLAAESRRDSLTPVVRQLVSRDLPLTFWPYFLFPMGYQTMDRGTVLDQQWRLLGRPVAQLADLESAGKIPSLVISPMIIETGRRMLISNLDLPHLTDTRPELGPLTPQSAVEFFKYVPEARQSFSLQTAIRTSATFPYVSPAVSLPTEPPRRLVDAGYYDNYGVNLAAAWAYHHRDWIAENTSGLAIIQLHAYATRATKRNTIVIGRPSPNLSARLFSALGQSFEWLTGPGAAALSAREWSMSFRNDEQLRVLSDFFNGRCPDFFESFEFENPTAFAMNWFLSQDDIALMRRSVATDANGEEFARLAAWWPREPRD
jgi:hypothetical protein